jgi:hypothetical protein
VLEAEQAFAVCSRGKKNVQIAFGVTQLESRCPRRVDPQPSPRSEVSVAYVERRISLRIQAKHSSRRPLFVDHDKAAGRYGGRSADQAAQRTASHDGGSGRENQGPGCTKEARANNPLLSRDRSFEVLVRELDVPKSCSQLGYRKRFHSGSSQLKLPA